MTKIIASICASAMLLAASNVVIAQEGARSVGKGLKCSQRLVPQTDGTLKLQQVCYKSI